MSLTIEALNNHIIFKFKDSINSAKQFVDKTKSGLVTVGQFDASAKDPRWGTVMATGPNVCDTLKQPGCEILIEPLKWTQSVYVEGIGEVWRTDESSVLAYTTPDSSEETQ